MFVFFGWSRLQGWSGDETWNVQYWTEPWQSLGAVSNSFVIWALILALAFWKRTPLLWVAAAAALVHIAFDFPLHGDDAHRHFWPVTDWRFFSPVSYWDPEANGLLGGLIETVVTFAAIIVLWMRFKTRFWRIVFSTLAFLQGLAFSAQIAWILSD